MTRTLERHHLGAWEVRATGDGRTVDATAVRYDVVDDYGTAFAPGCFAASLRSRLPALVWAHDWSRPVGNGTEVLEDSATRLRIRFRLDDPKRVPDAAQAQAQLASGTVADVSVGFMPEDVEPRTVGGARVPVFTRARLDEVSLVVRGAVPGSSVDQVRAPGALQYVPRELAVALVERAAAEHLLRERGLWPDGGRTTQAELADALALVERHAQVARLQQLVGTQ